MEPSKNSETPSPEKPGSPRLRRTLWIALLAAACLIGKGYYARYIAPYESTDNATIEAHVTPIAPQVSGRVARLCIQDNQEVKQGDLLFEIDPGDYEARRAQAEAGVAAAKSRQAQAQAQLAVAQTMEEQAKANVTAAEAEAARAEADLKRYQSVEIRAVSRSQVDAAQSQARATAAQADAARAKAHEAAAQVGLANATLLTAEADIRQSEAALRQAELNLSYTRITAPEGGRVTRRSVEKGAFVQPGQPLLTIVSHRPWVIANFKETQLEHMRPGQPVQIRVDAYPGLRLGGRVESIQAGAGARFSMFPPENATGNFIKVVQRVPVKIIFDTEPDALLSLGPGMSVEPVVRVK